MKLNEDIISLSRGVETGRGASFQKCPFSGGKMPFVFVKNVVQFAFRQWPLTNANIFATFPGKFF
jgi:hypothetical protein